MKHTIAALILLLCISFLFGCNKKTATKMESSPASSEVVLDAQSSETASQYVPSSNTVSSAVPSAALSSSASSKRNTLSSNQASSAVQSGSVSSNHNSLSSKPLPSSSIPTNGKKYSYDEDLARLCIAYHYNSTIVRSLVEGTLSSADLEKLKSEIKYYGDISGRPVYLSSSSKPLPSGIMSEAAAIKKAKEYTKTIYGYEIPENSFYHIYQFDNSKDVEYNARLKQEFYYEVSFIITTHNKNDIDCSIIINAKNGNCIGGNFLNRAIPYKAPTDDVISKMKDEALKFITDKNLAAGSRCIYIFTDFTSLEDPDSDGVLATELYLDNGYIIDIHESCQKSQLDFNIFPSHGFRS